ncbi:hypothetical protein FRC05_000430 [Tulasnella sp. 425]|nr:hypothetical protein FRC05_000430 [Tulasnella sp. 425]
MAGGKRVNLKKQQYARKLAKPRKPQEKSGIGEKEPAKNGDSKREQLPNSDARYPFVPSTEERPHLALFSASKPDNEHPANPAEGATSRDDAAVSDIASPYTPSAPQDDSEASPVEDLNSPHPDLWISFGTLQCLGNPAVSFPLRLRNDGSGRRSIMMGFDQSCDFIVFGPGVGRYHCLLSLELGRPDEGPLHRRVVVQKIRTIISPPSLSTTLWAGEEAYEVENKSVLHPGGIIQFGNGEKYLYQGPEFSSLYSQGLKIDGGEKFNSSVFQVQRLNDKRSFVAKMIPYSKIRMATKEIAIYKILGHHPRIAQFIEAFYDFKSGTHCLILEEGYKNLYRYTLQMRPEDQYSLQINAPLWIEQITSGAKYIHGHGIAHRDIKPQNIVVFVAPSGTVTMKVIDMGLARQNEGPVVEPWLVGTQDWTAPGPFMAYEDDRPVDCYGIGRIPFFPLTPDPWPRETRESERTCGCPTACRGQCTERRAALRVIEETGAGSDCVDFLEELLVGLPEECMNASEILQHPYLSDSNVSQEV